MADHGLKSRHNLGQRPSSAPADLNPVAIQAAIDQAETHANTTNPDSHPGQLDMSGFEEAAKDNTPVQRPRSGDTTNDTAADQAPANATQPGGVKPAAGGPSLPVPSLPGGGLPGAPGALGKIGSFIGGHKRQIGGGGGILGVIISLVIGYASLLPLKILHIEANLFHHNTNVEEAVEKKIATKLFKSSLSPYDDQGRYKITGRGFFGNKWGKFRLDRFEQRLAQKGIKLTSEKGKLMTIEMNGQVEDVSKLGQLDKLIKLSNIVNDQVPVWRIGKRVTFIRLMTIRYGVSFKFWTGEQIKSFGDYLKARAKEIREGASSAEIDAAKAARDQASIDPKNPNAPPKNSDTIKAGDEATQTVQDEFAKTGDIKSAIKSGAAKLKGSKALGISGLIILVCGLQEMANQAIAHGYDLRAEELMRFGGNFLSAAAQQRKGDKNYAQGIAFLAKQLEPDPNAKPVKVGSQTVTPEAGLDFTAGADWQRATAGSAEAGAPELAGGANPDAQTGFKTIMDGVNSVLDAGGVGTALCKVALSPIGLIISGVELAANLLDGGVEEAVATSIKLAFQVYVMVKVVPDILSAAAGLAITGTEDAVQQVAMSNAGMALMFADYSRAIGMMPVSDQTYAAAATQVNQQEIADARHQSLAYNLFSTDNPKSFVSKLIDASPSSPQLAVVGALNNAFHFPAFLSKSFLAAISPARAADNNDNPNKFQRYLLTDDAIDRYTPEFIVNYFEQPIGKANGQDVARIDAMGDPDKFQYGNEDSNKNDALHCFVNSFRNPYESKQGDDPVCQNIGYLTQNDNVTPVSDAALAAGIQLNVYNPWCSSAGVINCPQVAADEMTRYALYLSYQHAGDEFYNIQLNDAETKAAGASLNVN